MKSLKKDLLFLKENGKSIKINHFNIDNNQIFFYYDEPMIFIAKIMDKEYFVLACDEDENNLLYLAKDLSPKEKKDLRNGKISMYQFFQKNDILVVQLKDNEKYQGYILKPELVKSKWLPEKDAFLNQFITKQFA